MPDNLTAQEFALRKQKNQQNDLRNLLMATLLEARGEGEEGMFAVARSIYNRKNLIESGQVLPSTFMPDSKNKKPSYTDIITYEDQYAVYDGDKNVFKRQKSKITQEDVDTGIRAIQIALCKYKMTLKCFIITKHSLDLLIWFTISGRRLSLSCTKQLVITYSKFLVV
jgi:hypothetical protein